MKHLIVALIAVLLSGSAFVARATTTNGDDSCDIGRAPAATLLLPYFEVDFQSSPTTARTTLFTITNVSALPQIAHVVVWTDWAFPALSFNIFLPGYGVRGINLYDVFAHGTIASGSQPAENDANPNITSLAGCTNPPGTLPQALLTDLQLIFTTGKGTGVGIGCTSQVGGRHPDAIGYITIDVAPTCHTSLPNQSTYFTQILFDNVLIGDYQDVAPNPATGNYAGGNPLVHIRAVPEGGPAGSIPGTNLPYTFYDLYTAGTGLPRTIDRRQPLPSTFAARYIQGGTGALNTNYKIWREGISTGACSGAQAASLNSNLDLVGPYDIAIVRFDEHENATIRDFYAGGIPEPQPGPGTPAAGSYSAGGPYYYYAPTFFFPPLSSSGDLGGWMYLNLNNGGSASYSTARTGFTPEGSHTRIRPSQNWVIVSMFAEGRYSADFDAAWLGNGCSPAAILTTNPGGLIGPAGGVPVCPAASVDSAPVMCAPGSFGPYGGTNATP